MTSPSPLIDRVFAYLVDYFLQMIITLIGLFILSANSGAPLVDIDSRSGLEPFYLIFVFLVEPVYNIIFLFAMGNTTPGKKLLKLKIINLNDPEKLGWGQIIFREILKKVYYTMFSIISIPIDFVLITISKRKRSLIDYLANTQVIKLAANKESI